MKDVLKAVLLLLGFILLFPLIYAAIIAFKGELLAIPSLKQIALFKGAGLFLIIFLFVYDFKEFFELTLQGLSKVFAFTGNLSSGVGYVIPVYVVLTIVTNLVLVIIEKAHGLESLVLIVFGFFLMMHWVLSAKHLFNADTTLLKSQYYFVYSFLMLANLLIGAFLLNWLISEFSSWSFLTNAYNLAKENYVQIWHFLFVDGK